MIAGLPTACQTADGVLGYQDGLALEARTYDAVVTKVSRPAEGHYLFRRDARSWL
jgi:hypothetical protein